MHAKLIFIRFKYHSNKYLIMAFLTKLRHFKDCQENSKIYDIYYNEPVDEDIVYLESRNGKDFTGNIFRIAEELSTGKYGDLKIYVYANEDVKSKIIRFQKNYNLKIHKIITDENRACRILQKAKYIFTDSGVNHKFIKKPGQILLNTWHGTPLKLMGFDNAVEQASIGIIQRTFFFSDYLLYPNFYMRDKMLNSFMFEKICPSKILLEGYPRNSVFLTDNTAIKEKLGLAEKEVFVYMPTFKGSANDIKDEKQKADVNNFLEKIDVNLNDNQVLFVKFHPYNQSRIDFTNFKFIRPFPEIYENYDVLNAADCLITDYSSVFFDFAATRRKIIIFNYDEEEYLAERGLYFGLDELPFPKVQTTEQLISEMNADKNYDDSEFFNDYCSFEDIGSAARICETVIKGENNCRYEIIENSNKNILIYADGLKDNDTTNSLIEWLNSLDKSMHNIFVSFKPWDENIKKNHISALKRIPRDVEFLPLSDNVKPTISEKLNLDKFLKNTGDEKLYGSLKKLFEKSFKKQYGDFKFDLIIDFNTRDVTESLIFANSNTKTAIFIDESSNRNIYNKFDYACKTAGELDSILESL